MKHSDVLDSVRSHFDKQLNEGLDIYGLEHTPMWMSSLDTRTGRYPVDDTRPAHIGKRVYRNIDAPRGCSMYWDQPMLVAAHALSEVTGQPHYAEAADAYVAAFLDRCIASNGIFLWGNHYYYDAFDDVVMKFKSRETPVPVDYKTEMGDYHEIRPIPPAWGLFDRISKAKTERAIRVSAFGHISDEETGEFNRHADRQRGCAFLEHGGTVIESLAWLYNQTGDESLLGPMTRVAEYSFKAQNLMTGLLENNPTKDRWDKVTATTEVGLWAGCLLRADAYIGRTCFERMADEAMQAWLKYGYDEREGRYYGRLHVADGSPIFGSPETAYEPGDYADLWRPLFPAHDYPMAMAECCLQLYRLTGRESYASACQRWAEQIQADLPARDGQGGYAEHYGRCLHFLLGCAGTFEPSQQYENLARQVADEAMRVLYSHNMFCSHPGEDRYDAVDGMGFLLLAMIWLETGKRPKMMGLGW